MSHPLQKFLIAKGLKEGRKLTAVKKELSKKAGVSYGFIDMIIAGSERPDWPQTVNRIIFATGGAVTTRDLRPDIVEAVLESEDLKREVKRGR